MQKVNLGRTWNGSPGYFTNGYLALSLSKEDYRREDEWHKENAERWGFEFVGRSEVW